MNEKIKNSLLQGKYKEAGRLCKDIDEADIKDIIMMIAYETESIYVYSFVQYMINRTGEENWIKLAIEVMVNPLCFIEGAYSVALFHTRELLLIKKNVENLERIIFFYNIPEKLVEEEEIQYIVEEILKIEPDNKLALEVQQHLVLDSNKCGRKRDDL